MHNLQKIGAVCAVAAPLLAANTIAKAEDFIGIYGGYQFGAKGTNMKAQEDLNYTGTFTDKHPATASDVMLDNNFTVGIRMGRYFDSLPGFGPGFGVEIEGQYSRPNFKRQNVTINLTNTNLGGHSSFTEDQLPADFHMVTGGVNLLYRFQPIEKLNNIRPYIGGGPAVTALFIRGSGNSCRIVAPAALTRGFCNGGNMASAGTGIGFNAKAGVEIPINDQWSLDAEYKYTQAQTKVKWFRSFSDIDVDYQAHNVTAGLRFKF